MSNIGTVQGHLLQVQLSKFQACMPPILPPVPWQDYRSVVPLSPEFCHRLTILLIHGSSLSQLIGVHTTSKMCFFCPNSRLNLFFTCCINNQVFKVFFLPLLYNLFLLLSSLWNLLKSRIFLGDSHNELRDTHCTYYIFQFN